MKYMVACGDCGSVNMDKDIEVLGKGTIGEREEIIFKCNNCGHTMNTDEIFFEEW